MIKQIIKTQIQLALAVLLGLSHPQPKFHAPKVRQHGYLLNHKAIQRAKLFTVLISNEGFGPLTRGTGVLIDSTHVLTCAHVVEGKNDMMLVTFYPGYFAAHAKPVYVNREKDLAIIELDVRVNNAPKPLFQEQYKDGQPVTIIGNILGSMKWFVSYGVISGENERDLYTDGLVLGGDSGGPWINDRGEVVALSDWGLIDRKGNEIGINGGISAHTINDFLKAYNSPNPLFQLFGEIQ
jgi:S1-C subfamily serine protease